MSGDEDYGLDLTELERSIGKAFEKGAPAFEKAAEAMSGAKTAIAMIAERMRKRLEERPSLAEILFPDVMPRMLSERMRSDIDAFVGLVFGERPKRILLRPTTSHTEWSTRYWFVDDVIDAPTRKLSRFTGPRRRQKRRQARLRRWYTEEL